MKCCNIKCLKNILLHSSYKYQYHFFIFLTQNPCRFHSIHLLMLKQYNLFLESFQFACKNYKGNTNEADIAKVMGFESNDEYNEIMFLREITHTVNAFNDMADIVRLYSKKPEMAEQRLENLLSEVLYEDSDSV